MTPRRGMTLLEVAVALTIAATALVAGASVLGFLADQQIRPGEATPSSAYMTRSVLRDWIAEARLTTEGDAAFVGQRESLSFVTSARTPVSVTGTTVRLSMRDGIVAELTPWRHPGETMVLRIDHPGARLDVRYLASLEGARRWQADWSSTSVLPAAVDVRIVPDPATDSRANALLAIPMTVVLESRR